MALVERIVWSRRGSNPLSGGFGEVDGNTIKVCKLRTSDCQDPTQHNDRKDYYAVPVQSMCDESYRFLFFLKKCSAPKQDSAAFSVCSHCGNLNEGKLSCEYFVAGDEANICGIEKFTTQV